MQYFIECSFMNANLSALKISRAPICIELIDYVCMKNDILSVKENKCMDEVPIVD